MSKADQEKVDTNLTSDTGELNKTPQLLLVDTLKTLVPGEYDQEAYLKDPSNRKISTPRKRFYFDDSPKNHIDVMVSGVGYNIFVDRGRKSEVYMVGANNGNVIGVQNSSIPGALEPTMATSSEQGAFMLIELLSGATTERPIGRIGRMMAKIGTGTERPS